MTAPPPRVWTAPRVADIDGMRRIVLACALSALAVAAGTAEARPNAARSWATPQIHTVVDAGFLGTLAKPRDQSNELGERRTSGGPQR